MGAELKILKQTESKGLKKIVARFRDPYNDYSLLWQLRGNWDKLNQRGSDMKKLEYLHGCVKRKARERKQEWDTYFTESWKDHFNYRLEELIKYMRAMRKCVVANNKNTKPNKYKFEWET